jgi:hypothetical protein
MAGSDTGASSETTVSAAAYPVRIQPEYGAAVARQRVPVYTVQQRTSPSA